MLAHVVHVLTARDCTSYCQPRHRLCWHYWINICGPRCITRQRRGPNLELSGCVDHWVVPLAHGCLPAIYSSRFFGSGPIAAACWLSAGLDFHWAAFLMPAQHCFVAALHNYHSNINCSELFTTLDIPVE